MNRWYMEEKMEARMDLYMSGRLTPGNGQGDSFLVFLSHPVGKQMSFHHPSLFPGLVAKAVFMPRIHKKIKSYQNKTNRDSVVRKEADRHLWTTMPPTYLSSSTQNRRAIDICFPTHHAEWVEDVTQSRG